jgi:hypothetical protein
VHAPLVFEFASPTECDEATGSVPGDLRYYTLRVCPSAGGPCASLVDQNGEHGASGSDTIGILRDSSGHFTVDAQVDRGTLYDVTVYAYQGEEGASCRASAVGRSLGVRFGQDTVRVRLHPFGGWSCAGAHEGSETSVPRGLHQAVLLPNREVLLLGGVTSPVPSAAASRFESPIGPQITVEVFDPRDARFHSVSMVDEDGQPGLSRVMFEARFVSMMADGRYEIRLSGGYDPRAASATVGFDAQARSAVQSVLYGPVLQAASDRAFRRGARLVYDPATRSATITSAPADGAACGTAAASAGPRFAAVCGIGAVTAGATPTYTLASTWYSNGQGAGPARMLAGRVGATITELSPTRFLIWGGDVATASGPLFTDAEMARLLAGEVVTAETTTPGIAVPGHDASMADDGRPWVTAYHAATPIQGATGAVSILFVGGLVPGGGTAPLVNPAMTPAPDGLTVARFGADGSFRSGVRVSAGTTELASLLSTASPLDDDGSRVLVAGGALIDRVAGPVGETIETLFGVSTVGIVTYTATGDSYAWSDVVPLRFGRWGHTTTVIPGYGVLVVGGLRRDTRSIEVLDHAELLLEDDLPNGTPVPPSHTCEGPPDGGVSGTDAGRDAGVARDSGATEAGPRDAGAVDAAMAADVGVDAP